jgi:hypothetical protein
VVLSKDVIVTSLSSLRIDFSCAVSRQVVSKMIRGKYFIFFILILDVLVE